MTYEIIFSDRAFKELKKREKNTQERVIAVLERIRIRPENYITPHALPFWGVILPEPFYHTFLYVIKNTLTK